MTLAFFEARSTPEPNTGCWLWTRCVAGHMGYGRVGIPRQRKTAVAHRAAWETLNGPVPAGMLVCHRCDQPSCVNPAHMFLGTPRDNSRDMAAKGRSATQRHPEIVRGENSSSAKLTAKDVLEIREIMSSGGSSSMLAARFGVSAGHVRRLARGKCWRFM